MSYALTRTVVAAFATTLIMTGSAFAAPASAACSIMSKAEIKPFSTNRLFDQSPAEEMQEGRGSSCSYAGVYIQLDVIRFATIENMSRDQRERIEAVRGVGDAAYVRNNRDDYAELYARIGQRTFTIQLDIGPQETFASARPRLLQMGAAMAAKFR